MNKNHTQKFMDIEIKEWKIFHLHDLEKIAEYADKNSVNFPIYFILKKEKIDIIEETLKIKEFDMQKGTVCGHFYAGKDKKNKYVFRTKLGKYDRDLEIKLTHPNHITISKNNAILHEFPTYFIIDGERTKTNYERSCDFEVMYIGQSKGKNQSISALDRLRNHETLQKILAENDYNTPEKQILILVACFKAGFFHAYKNPKNINEESHSEFLKLKEENQQTNDHIINLIEAMLIKYFNPAYNTHYTEEFPSKKHKSYEFIYKYNLNFIEFLLILYSENLGFHICLFSEKVKKSEEQHFVLILNDEDGHVKKLIENYDSEVYILS